MTIEICPTAQQQIAPPKPANTAKETLLDDWKQKYPAAVPAVDPILTGKAIPVAQSQNDVGAL